MWGDHAAAPMNLVRLGFGLGAIFVNLLVRPFLTKNISPIALPSNTVTETKANIFIPYSITAGLCVLIAVGHLFFYIRALKSERDKIEVRQVIRNQRKVISLSLIFRLTMLLLVQIRKM
jgi:fucose permease